VLHFNHDDNSWKIVQVISTLEEKFQVGYSCAEIQISNDGNFVYGSNRGHHSIAIFKVEKDSGKLEFIKIENVRGKTPRHFILTEDDQWLIVANQDSHNLVVFKRDKSTGLLTFNSEEECFSPVCVILS